MIGMFCIICVVIIGLFLIKENNLVVLIMVVEQIELMQEVFEVGVSIVYCYVCDDEG